MDLYTRIQPTLDTAVVTVGALAVGVMAICVLIVDVCLDTAVIAHRSWKIHQKKYFDKSLFGQIEVFMLWFVVTIVGAIFYFSYLGALRVFRVFVKNKIND